MLKFGVEVQNVCLSLYTYIHIGAELNDNDLSRVYQWLRVLIKKNKNRDQFIIIKNF